MQRNLSPKRAQLIILIYWIPLGQLYPSHFFVNIFFIFIILTNKLTN